MALEPAASVARGTEPAALRLDRVHRDLRAFDAVSRVKRFETSQEMRAPAFAETAGAGVALFFRDQAKILLPGEAGVFEPTGRPGEPPPAAITVRIDGAEPESWDSSTIRVRFRADKAQRLPPGATGAVKFDTRLRRGLVIKATAVLQSPDGPYVLVATDERRTLTKRPVEVGSIIQGYIGVEGGLREGEWVVAKNTFSLDAARKMGWRRTP